MEISDRIETADQKKDTSTISNSKKIKTKSMWTKKRNREKAGPLR